MFVAPAAIRSELTRLHRAPEPEILAGLLPAVTLDPAARARVVTLALDRLADLRAGLREGWVNQFLHEYRLNSSEGVALLSLAEAFLRVPDPATADLLIADKLGDADWRAHAGRSHSALVNSATWGLVIGRALVGQEARAGVLKRLVARAGEPFVRQAVGAAMKMMGEIFVMGRTVDEAIRRMARPEHRGFTASFDMLGEAARTYPDAQRYYAAYEGAIAAVGRARRGGGIDAEHSISVKLSALHPRYEVAQRARCVPALTEMLAALCTQAAAAGIGLTVDAEESERLEMSLDIIGAVAALPALGDWDGLGMAVQAYGKRARAVVGWAEALGEATARRLTVRLVKGAYWDSEIKRTQEAGLADYPLFTRKAATDVSYLACARDMLAAAHIYPAFASHNALTVATILEWAGPSRDFEFQRLHGMGDGLYEKLVRDDGYHTRIYAPVGGHRDLLAYLVRRLLENGANSSFVHQLADESLSDEMLLADPAERIARARGAGHVAIPAPRDLFGGGRINSAGLDLSDAGVLAETAAAVRSYPGAGRGPVPDGAGLDPGLRRGTAAEPGDGAALPSRHAGERRDPVAAVGLDPGLRRGTGGGTAKAAVDRAAAGFARWSATPLDARAATLERLADLLEAHRAALMAFAVQEARKTIPDALGEVREAVDFCRYYALEARRTLAPHALPGPTGERNILRHEGRGVWACIAPWNFPLAIFIGQIAAALVAGNSVVAKPAPQTPGIAGYAVDLAHEAGVPADALVLLTGGPDEGAALVADARVAGVAFTGSTATARRIARALLTDDARPLVPLIAETGGINAMLVDSTALPEQVVADVVASGFRSAGQRCSALRLLLLQEDIAERTLTMLAGAMDTLVVGDPADPATDIGPVIDRSAYDRLMGRRDAMRGRIVHEVAVPADGLFVPPTLIRLDDIDDLDQEWFGPIVHVATWPAGMLEQTIGRVNAKGYGLTMGLHSRIARAAETTEALARVGNLYVNRSMIGAIVGSQPFGGEGLSGTGPKAGGPHYLPRFAAERVTSTDTTSAGGNATLLSLDDVGF